MKLKSLNRVISFLILFSLFFPLYAEEKKQIDIWNKEKKENSEESKKNIENSNTIINSNIFKSLNNDST